MPFTFAASEIPERAQVFWFVPESTGTTTMCLFGTKACWKSTAACVYRYDETKSNPWCCVNRVYRLFDRINHSIITIRAPEQRYAWRSVENTVEVRVAFYSVGSVQLLIFYVKKTHAQKYHRAVTGVDFSSWRVTCCCLCVSVLCTVIHVYEVGANGWEVAAYVVRRTVGRGALGVRFQTGH
jgi:hypothetical protein